MTAQSNQPNPSEPSDPLEAEVVRKIRSAQADVTGAVQMLVGMCRLQKQMIDKLTALEKAVLDKDNAALTVALEEITAFRKDIVTKAEAYKDSQPAGAVQ